MNSNAIPSFDRAVVVAPGPQSVVRSECYAPAKAADVIRVGVVGYGYWGPNVVRNVHALDNCEAEFVAAQDFQDWRSQRKMAKINIEFGQFVTTLSNPAPIATVRQRRHRMSNSPATAATSVTATSN